MRLKAAHVAAAAAARCSEAIGRYSSRGPRYSSACRLARREDQRRPRPRHAKRCACHEGVEEGCPLAGTGTLTPGIHSSTVLRITVIMRIAHVAWWRAQATGHVTRAQPKSVVQKLATPGGGATTAPRRGTRTQHARRDVLARGFRRHRGRVACTACAPRASVARLALPGHGGFGNAEAAKTQEWQQAATAAPRPADPESARRTRLPRGVHGHSPFR